MSDKGEKESSLSIPKILADFFLKKLDMSSDSEDSNHRHKNWKKKSKHKKHKHHKKSKNRFRHDSSDSTSKSSDLNSKEIVDDLSSSEEMGIKRLKKIKSMKFQPVSNGAKPSVSVSDDPNMDKNGQASSTANENLVYYGPSLELLLSGVESSSASSKADATTHIDKLPAENKDNNVKFSSGKDESNMVNDSESTVEKEKLPDLCSINETVLEGMKTNNTDVISNNNSSNNNENDVDSNHASLDKNSSKDQAETSQKEIEVANTDKNGEKEKGEQEKDPNSSVNQICNDEKVHSRSRSRSKSRSKHVSPKSKQGKRSSRSSSRDSHHSHKRRKKGSRSRSRSRRRSRGHGLRRSHSRNRSRSRSKKHRKNLRSLSPHGRFSNKKMRSRSRSHGRHKKHSRSRSRSHSHGKRKARLHSRSRSKSHGKHKKRSHSRSRSKSHGRRKKYSHSRSRSKSRGKPKRHSLSRSRSKSHGKQKKHSHSRSRSKSQGKSKKHSHSRSRSKSLARNKKHSHSRSRSKSHGRNKKHSHSRSRSKSKLHGKHKKHSHSKSRSRSHDRSKKNLHKRSRSRSHGRHKKFLHGRSRSRSHGRHKRHLHSRSRSRSLGRHRKRSGSRTRTHSGYIEGSSSKDKDQSNPKRKNRSRSNSKSKQKSHSREKSISKEKKSNKIDQAKILETARKNVLKMMKDGTLPEGLVVENIVKEQFVSIQSGGKSVQELTDFCQRLSQKENELENSDKDDKPDDATGFIHHPFKVKEPGMIKLNIKNAVQLPIKTHAQKIAETTRLSSQFPVSSGNQHKQKELEWIPVVPEATKKEAKPVVMTVATISEPAKAVPVKTEPPVSSIPIPVSYPVVAPEPPAAETPAAPPPLMPPPLPPPPPPMPSLLQAHLQPAPVFQPPVQQPVAPSYTMPNQEMMVMYEPPPTTISTSTSVFKPPKKLDIPAIVAKRFQALTKLQENPNDPEALKTIHDAQESIQEWVESQQVPGLFTGSTDAKVLSAAELCGPFKYHKFRKDFLSHAPPVTEGKGMSLLKKMGWNPGEGLGKNKEGSLEPLMLDIKTDKKGLVSEGENSKKGISSFTKELQGKHPVSALMELCSKRKWKPPLYTCVLDQGPSHRKHFCFKVEVNGVKYQPLNPSANKKIAKADAAVLCLQSLNILPKTA